RTMTITGAARLAGILGWPVSHSLSPILHGYWLQALKIDGAFVPLPVRPEELSVVVRGLMEAGFRGMNVTVPHKEAAFALAHTAGKAGEAAGAANLLVFDENGKIAAHNTDALGLQASLEENLGKNALKGRPVVVLGAGGAARAAILALAGLGASEIRILNRT